MTGGLVFECVIIGLACIVVEMKIGRHRKQRVAREPALDPDSAHFAGMVVELRAENALKTSVEAFSPGTKSTTPVECEVGHNVARASHRRNAHDRVRSASAYRSALCGHARRAVHFWEAARRPVGDPYAPRHLLDRTLQRSV